MSGLWFDEVLFSRRDYDVPGVCGGKPEHEEPENELDDERDQVSLLSADSFCRVGRAAFRAGEG